MVARPISPIQLGSLKIIVLGPTAKQLEKLREDWIKWLDKKKGTLRAAAQSAQAGCRGLAIRICRRSMSRGAAQEVAFSIEKDVTPPNLASLVLLVEEDGKRVLLTGDAGDESLLEVSRAPQTAGCERAARS